MKLLTWTKNITTKMVVIWAVSFTLLLVVVFGSISLGLGLSRVTYGATIDNQKIMYIEYRNDVNMEIWGRNEKQLDAESLFTQHTNPMQEILNLLERGSRTNKLSNLFRGGPSQEVVSNNLDNRFTATFINSFSNNSVVIYFATPQYSVETTASRTQFRLTETATVNNEQIHAIFIPLDRTQNRFQRQTWYLLTLDPNNYPPGQSLTISNRITTYGNYHRLGNFVRDLQVFV